MKMGQTEIYTQEKGHIKRNINKQKEKGKKIKFSVKNWQNKKLKRNENRGKIKLKESSRTN